MSSRVVKENLRNTVTKNCAYSGLPRVDGWQKYTVMGCASKLFPAIELGKLETERILLFA